jgi:hypothetical protein
MTTTLEHLILERKRTLVLNETQAAEVKNRDKLDIYMELVATREILEEEQPSKRKKYTTQNLLQFESDVHENTKQSLMDSTKPGCNSLVAAIAEGGINLIEKMHKDFWSKVWQAIVDDGSSSEDENS